MRLQYDGDRPVLIFENLTELEELQFYAIFGKKMYKSVKEDDSKEVITYLRRNQKI